MNSATKSMLIQLTEQELRSQVAKVLNLPVAEVSLEQPIVELGFGLSSVSAFVENLNRDFGFVIQPALFFEYATLKALAHYLVDSYQAQIMTTLGFGQGNNPPVTAEPVAPSQSLSIDEIKQKVYDNILAKVAERLSLSTSDFDIDAEVIELGFDSLSLTRFAESLSGQYGIDIHLGIFFEYTTLRAFGDYLLSEHLAAIKQHYGADKNSVEPIKVPQGAMAKPINGFDNKPMPVIIGSGITGMFISRALSEQQIEHIMIGEPVTNDVPRLGESMNEIASIDLIQQYPEFSDYFFVKREITFYHKDKVALLNLRGKKGHTFFDAYDKLGFNPQTEYANMIHIDRLGFDRAMAASIKASPYCKIIPNVQVTGVEADVTGDTVSKLNLNNGQQLLCSYVFDATNHIRLLGQQLKLDAEVIDSPRYVFFTHYCRDKADMDHCLCGDEIPWLHATNILRLHSDIDGIDGVAWCIPAGDYVSVGVSVDGEQGKTFEREQVISLLNQAYARRGLDYLSLFPHRREIVLVPGTRHFYYHKIFGKNWLMAGGAAAQFWFPSSSNLSISLMAAKIAPKVVMGEAEKWLDVYRNVTLNLEKIHWVYDSWITDKCENLTDLGLFAKAIYSTGNRRMGLYAMVRNGEQYYETAKQMSQSDIPKYAMMSQEIRVMNEQNLAEQTNRLAQARESLMAFIDKMQAKQMDTQVQPAAVEVL